MIPFLSANNVLAVILEKIFRILEEIWEKSLRVTHRDFIARGYGEPDAAVCHFLRGYNAGLAEVLKGRNLEACETRCTAKGDDCYEFVMKRVD